MVFFSSQAQDFKFNSTYGRLFVNALKSISVQAAQMQSVGAEFVKGTEAKHI